MATGYKICKVCGREYEYCMTNRRDTIFRWQDVACCAEHGAIYFRQVAESRGEVQTAPVAKELPDDDSFDALFEEDFDDGEEELEITM
ncbi:MAG: hypothetical protein O0V67_05900 [Methanocorpusculum sp.]|nr:hypothetical protein [Methanocorpusculum sp.]